MADRIVVFEKRPRWAPELQRQLNGAVRVTACRSAGDAEAECGAGCVSVVVADIGAAPGPVLEFLGRRTGSRPAVIAVASGRSSELEWPARELGAAAFVSDSVTGEELAALCRRLQ